jgi:hypothetical protein
MPLERCTKAAASATSRQTFSISSALAVSENVSG